jgi:hypothetical protein
MIWAHIRHFRAHRFGEIGLIPKPLPKPLIFLYARGICDVGPALGHMQRIGGGGNGAAIFLRALWQGLRAYIGNDQCST